LNDLTIYHKKILELKPEFSNVLLISSDLNETIDEISKIKCKNLIYLSQYEIFKKEFFKNKSIPIATVIGGGYSNDKLELAKRHSLIFKATSMVFN